MAKIITIGGGEIYDKSTLLIDKEIVAFAKKKNPKLLFIPTASNDSSRYVSAISKHFSNLGCTVSSLLLKNKKLSFEEIESEILQADIIYVGGGNTISMMKTWKKHGVDICLKKALEKDIVLCGLSAGSICWYTHGQSDSWKFKKNPEQFVKASGLGFIKAFHCPHYNMEERKKDFSRITKNISEVLIAIDDNCALQIDGNLYRVISGVKSAKAYKCFWKDKKLVQQEIVQKSDYSCLEKLLDVV